MQEHRRRSVVVAVVGTIVVCLAIAAMAVAAAPPGGRPRAGSPPTTAPPTTSATIRPDVAATVSQLGSWHLVGHETRFEPASDGGLASVDGPAGPVVAYRGDVSIPAAELAQGWDHIGDPDAWHGDIIDAYQGPPGATAKMFLLTTPGGVSYEYTHVLSPGELLNNSFAAVSPDGQWMVAGEWGTMARLLVFPTPRINPATSPTGGSLAQAGVIALDHSVRDVQGCDFVTSTRLLCSTDDPGTDLWPTDRQLLQVQLPRALDGRPVTGFVTDLGPLPQTSACRGTFEAEGIDYDPATGILRVEVVPPLPCGAVTTIYDYQD